MNKIQVLLASGLSLFALASCSQQEPVLNEPNVNLAELDPNVVTLQEAVDMASEHYSGFFGTTRSGKPISLKGFEILRRAQTRTDETPDSYGYYILNFENDGGFAIVSADRRNEGVYAISDEGSLHLSDTLQNGGLNWYLNTYLRITPINPPVPNDPFPDTTKHEIVQPTIEYVNYCTPRLTGVLTRFSEWKPYNKYCFTSSGKQARTGDAPVAFGTIMGYYKWPQSYSASAPEATFDWEAMRASANDDGWARLFEILGRPENFDVSYGENSTICFDPLSPLSDIRKNMGYTMTSGEFNLDVLIDEMKAFRPCILRGVDSNKNKHCWIVDAGQRRITTTTPLMGDPTTKTELFFHCVWGWGGNSNGYYKMNNLYQSYDKNGIPINDHAIIGDPKPRDEDCYGNAPDYDLLTIIYGITPQK